jgi:hypothetical protein
MHLIVVYGRLSTGAGVDRRYSPGRASAIRRWGTGIDLIADGLLAVPVGERQGGNSTERTRCESPSLTLPRTSGGGNRKAVHSDELKR